MAQLRICLSTSEVTPFAKTGGLADVTAALARYLSAAGHDARLFVPFYSTIPAPQPELLPVGFLRDVPVTVGARTLSFTAYTTRLPGTGCWIYLIHCPALYDRPGIYSGNDDDALRFAFLCRATIECCQRMGFAPHVFHCHDWHSALLPLTLRSLYDWDQLFHASRTVLTLHNIGYQGTFSSALLGEIGLESCAARFHQEDLAGGVINFLKTGILYADFLTTVSPTHARELMTAQYGAGLDGLLRQRRDHLAGILNGVDHEIWNPQTDPLIPHHYSPDDLAGKARDKEELQRSTGLEPDPEAALLGIVSRLTPQKGFDLVFEPLAAALARRHAQLVVLGQGEARYERLFSALEARFRGRVCFWRGKNERLAHLIEAGADIFLMPSLYEPCGLNQMYSLKYGTPPVVRRTGGLADSVEPFDPETGHGTGFVFEHYSSEGFAWALDRALTTFRDEGAWRRLQGNGMARDFSWETQIGKYVAMYSWLAGV